MTLPKLGKRKYRTIKGLKRRLKLFDIRDREKCAETRQKTLTNTFKLGELTRKAC
ncbi:MAG: hypothetical protein LBD03_04595 [Methanobrevibacter sp.]|nr:hypothetical protein [Candidatus Methanovirga procula]